MMKMMMIMMMIMMMMIPGPVPHLGGSLTSFKSSNFPNDNSNNDDNYDDNNDKPSKNFIRSSYSNGTPFYYYLLSLLVLVLKLLIPL